MLNTYKVIKQDWQMTWWLISLLIFLCFPATALFQEHLGLTGVIIYVIVVFTVLFVTLKFGKFIHNLFKKYYIISISLVVAGLVVIFATIYPLETSGKFSKGSDRDEALNIAVNSLIRGHYPYYEKTYLGGEITPLPGAILLSAPFVALGNSAYQNLFWLLIFLYATSIYLTDKVSALVLLLTALIFSPSVQYEFISGGDLLANSIYVPVFLFLTIRVFSKSDIPIWVKLVSAVVLGISLASRPNFFILLPLLFALLVRKTNLKLATTCIITASLSASLVILPFYFFDPKSFTPLIAGNKLVVIDSFIPFASSGIIITTIGLSIILAVILIRNTNGASETLFFWMGALTQFFPMFAVVLLSTIMKGFLDFSFMHDRFGLMFLFLGLWGCWKHLYNNLSCG